MIVTISYTPLDAPGGVPRFNRDLHSAFPSGSCVHYSWWDVAQASGFDPNAQIIPEWEKARVLNSWLLRTGRVSEQDVVVADGFWADGLEHLPKCVSHQHGNWSHTTFEDVKAGIPPEFPMHAKVQENFRRKYLKAGRKLTTVSKFIGDQMRLQWGFDSQVINNGIDTSVFKPAEKKLPRAKPIVIHFTTTANKGFDHIEAVKKDVDAHVWLLDEAAQRLSLPKYEALAQADLVVHPSAHEGNSYAVLETLACGVPIVGYDVGLLYEIMQLVEVQMSSGNTMDYYTPGYIPGRHTRSPSATSGWTQVALKSCKDFNKGHWDPAGWAKRYDIEIFRQEWRMHLRQFI